MVTVMAEVEFKVEEPDTGVTRTVPLVMRLLQTLCLDSLKVQIRKRQVLKRKRKASIMQREMKEVTRMASRRESFRS